MKSFNASNSRVLQLLLLTTLAASNSAMAAKTEISNAETLETVSQANSVSVQKDIQSEIENLSKELARMQQEHQQKIDEMNSRLEKLAKQQSEQPKQSETKVASQNNSDDVRISESQSDKTKQEHHIVESAQQTEIIVQQKQNTVKADNSKTSTSDTKKSADKSKEKSKIQNTKVLQSPQQETTSEKVLGADEVVIDAEYMKKYNMSIAPTVEHTTKPLSKKEIDKEIGQINNQTIKKIMGGEKSNSTDSATDTNAITITDTQPKQSTPNKVEEVVIEDKKTEGKTNSQSTAVEPNKGSEAVIIVPVTVNDDKGQAKETSLTKKMPETKQKADSSNNSTAKKESNEPPAKPFVPANPAYANLATVPPVATDEQGNQQAVNKVSVEVDATTDPSELYLKALQAFAVAKTDEATALLNAYIQKYPNEALISKAHFWLGESHLQKEPANYAAARFEFLEVINRYADDPNNDKKIKALYRLSQLSKINNYDDELKSYVTILQNQYPTSEETKLATELLEQSQKK